VEKGKDFLKNLTTILLTVKHFVLKDFKVVVILAGN